MTWVESLASRARGARRRSESLLEPRPREIEPTRCDGFPPSALRAISSSVGFRGGIALVFVLEFTYSDDRVRGSIICRLGPAVTLVLSTGCFSDPPKVADAETEDPASTSGLDSMPSTSAETDALDSDDGTTSRVDDGTTLDGTDTQGCDPCSGELLSHLALPAGRLVALTPDGSLVVVGSYADPLDYLGEPLGVNGGADTFVARFDPSDRLQWVFRIHSPGQEIPHAVSVAANGAIAVSGTFTDVTVTMGTDETPIPVPQLGRNAYFGLFDPDGALIRARFVRSSVDFFGGLVATSTARLVSASGFTGTLIGPDGSQHDGLSGQDAFYVTIDEEGEQTVLDTWRGMGDVRAAHVAADRLKDGDSYVVGTFSGTATFGGHELESTGGTDMFILHVDFLGNVDWAYAAGGPGDDRAVHVLADGAGRPYLLGDFRETLRYGDGPELQSSGDTDLCLIALDHAGGHRWSTSFGGSGEEQARGGVATAEGLYIAGEFSAQADFGGPAPLQSAGGKDGFVAKYDHDGTLVWIDANGGSGTDIVNGIAVDDEIVVAALEFDGVIEIAPGVSVGTADARSVVILRYHP
jgi:hypothetical protein